MLKEIDIINNTSKKKWFNYNNGLHNFHTIVFTIIPSTITHVHEFHEIHKQNISFEPNDQNMLNEKIKTKWKVYENSTQSYYSIPSMVEALCSMSKKNYHTIPYLYYLWKCNLHEHQYSLYESNAKEI
jgi:hypothetical protein